MVRIEVFLKIITFLCVLTGYAAVVPYIQTTYAMVYAGMLALAMLVDFKKLFRLPRWMLNGASVVVLAVSVSHMTIDYFIEPILSALVVLSAIKLLEEKRFRDYMQIYLISMFLVIGSSLVSLSAAFLLYFSLLVFLATTSLIMLAYYDQAPELRLRKEVVRNVLFCSLLICSISVPASSAFFVVLPRTSFPLLGFLNKLGFGKTGFSDRVELGEVSEIQEDSGVIFRAEVESLPERSLYWRGVVLDRFDGKSWRTGQKTTPVPPRFPKPADGVHQTIYLEPYGNRYLFALDKPMIVDLAGSSQSGGLTHYLRRHVFERIRYTAVSVISDFFPDRLVDEDDYLVVPEDFSPGVRELVERLTAGGMDPGTVASKLVAFLKNGEFRYSLAGLPASDEPLEEFLLVEKRGNCEYFASALAVMLRLSGIPARLIGGYRGGYYNTSGRYYMVLHKNAHVWVEGYWDGGWRRLDPTPYSAENPAVDFGNSLLLKLKLQLDLFNYYWGRLIVGYDFSTQLEILRKLRESVEKPDLGFIPEKDVLGRYALYGGAASLLIFAVVFGVMRWRSREERILGSFLRVMARHGYERRRTEGLDELVARVGDDELRDRARRFVDIYQRACYKAGIFSGSDFSRLRALLKEM